MVGPRGVASAQFLIARPGYNRWRFRAAKSRPRFFLFCFTNPNPRNFR